MKTNMNLFPSNIKTHQSNNRSTLGHRTSDSRILHFDSFSTILMFFLFIVEVFFSVLKVLFKFYILHYSNADYSFPF